MNKEEIENKIEEILNKNIVTGNLLPLKGTAYTFGIERLKKELIALIQKSNKEAVDDFVKYEEKEDETAGFPNGLHAKHLIIQESNREAIEKFRSFCEGEVYEKRLSDEHYVLVSILIDTYLSSIGKDK